MILQAVYHYYQRLKMYSTVPGGYPQLEQSRVFGCLPITPSSKSGGAHGLRQEGVGAQTPDTPELYSALNLSYTSRSVRFYVTLVQRSKSSRLLVHWCPSVLPQKQRD